MPPLPFALSLATTVAFAPVGRIAADADITVTTGEGVDDDDDDDARPHSTSNGAVRAATKSRYNC